MAGKKGSKMSGAKIAIFVVEFLVIAALVFVLFKFVIPMTQKTEESPTGLNVVSIEDVTPEELGISEEVQQAVESEESTMKGYLNIAFFGIDSTTSSVSSLEKGFRSDCIMICSINQDTGDVKLCSVYRDTYLNTGNDTYQKCNAAYAIGGGNAAVAMLNSNLDLDITNWIAVSYKGLADAVDSLGGVYIDVDSAEIGHLNNYQSCVAEFLDRDYTPVKDTGYQLLDGLQVCGYCRIRYTAGDDFKRTERQREVIQALLDQAKLADVDTLVSTFNKVSGSVLTTLDSDPLLSLVKNAANYTIVDQGGFPEESMRTTGTIGAKGSCVIPVDLESNVVWLHKFLFGDEDYQVSSTVKTISEKVYSDTNSYLQ